MEFKQAMRVFRRICKGREKCEGCVLESKCIARLECDHAETETILAKWVKEHPERTIADDFYEKFPKAPRKKDGTPEACARWIGYCNNCRDENGETMKCSACWRRPLEDVE